MQPTSRYNYYEVLELKANAPQHEVTAAYDRARATYSGENPAIYTIFSEKEARELLTVIEEAYQVLGNKILRNIYDQRLLSGKASLNDLSFEAILDASKHGLPEDKVETPVHTYKKDEAFEKKYLSKDTWMGEDLKAYREYKMMSVEKLSGITKINSYYIVAIENMNPDGLPAVVFVRGYVVQMAKALGLNEKIVADSYMKTFKNKLGN